MLGRLAPIVGVSGVSELVAASSEGKPQRVRAAVATLERQLPRHDTRKDVPSGRARERDL